MIDQQNLPVPRALDTATYLGIAMMSLLGISGFDVLSLQLIAVGLCLLFGVLYHFHLRIDAFVRNPNLYFGIQAILLTVLTSLGSPRWDAFIFLFLLLTIHTAFILPGRPATIWIILYYAIVSAIVLLIRGTDGIYAIFFYVSAFVLCGYFGYGIQQTERERDKNQKLLEELQSTQHKLQELAVLEERNRLARDLHDSVKQQVFAISMQLSAARALLSETDKAYVSVTQAEKLAQQAGAELTTLIHQLRPPGLEHKSLPTAVRDYAVDWSRQNNIEVRLSMDEDIRVDVKEEQVLFRVIQEALSNVARHSHAASVVIELVEVDSDILLCIADNGKGFEMEHIQNGLGLNSMKERLAQIGATFHVLSEKDGGTQISAKLIRSA
jgi:signal transduction histidine kinase